MKYLAILLLSVLAATSLPGCSPSEVSRDWRDEVAAKPLLLKFDTDSESIHLPLVQEGDQVYEYLTLNLRKDGTWRVKDVGRRDAWQPSLSIDAVLTQDEARKVDRQWQPLLARIAIRRIHVDHRIMLASVLRLEGNRWSWDQEGDASAAYSMADFAANRRLVATANHHVVLHAAPETPPQEFPMRLEDKVYNFCFDPQEQGGDTLTVLDSGGREVLSVKAGQPCRHFKASAGIYTVRHAYGRAGGDRSTLFLRGVSRPQPAAAKRLVRSSIADGLPYSGTADNPEYWGIYALPGWFRGPYYSANEDFWSNGGYLGVNYWNNYWPWQDGYALSQCAGPLDLAATVTGRARPFSDGSLKFPLSESQLFRIETSEMWFAGSYLGPTLSCDYWLSTTPDALLQYPYRYVEGAGASLASVFSYVSEGTGLPNDLKIEPLGQNTFRIAYGPVFVGWQDYVGTVSAEASVDALYQVTTGQFVPGPMRRANVDSATTFRVDYRWFPRGLPASMWDAGSASWRLADNEVALFSGNACAGPALILVGDGVALPPYFVSDYANSLQLGRRAAAVLNRSYGENSPQDPSDTVVVNDAGCISNLTARTGGWIPAQLISLVGSEQIVISDRRCEGCNLAGAMLGNVDLSGVKLSRANLTNAVLSYTTLVKADLRFANLTGARLNNANLEAANLCSTLLNANTAGAAALLTGAHMKNANLSGANLSGASLRFASFYSSQPQVCQPSNCGVYAESVCASAYGATMNNTDFSGAYLAGVDMSSTTAVGINFSNAILPGASFRNATLNNSSGPGVVSKFENAQLQGTRFDGARLRYASFYGAFVDADAGNKCTQFKLTADYTQFPGFAVSSPDGFDCVAPAPAAPTCVAAGYDSGAAPPLTDETNLCPDGSVGPCAATAWIRPSVASPISSSCNAATPVCRAADGSDTTNTCW